MARVISSTRTLRHPLTPVLLVSAVMASACVLSSADDDFAAPAGAGGQGPGHGTTIVAGSTTGAGAGAPQPIPPREPEPEEVPACEDLDPTKPLVLYLSADDSNSMASAAIAREQAGTAWPIPVRTYELLNYYRIGFPAAPPGTLSIFTQMEPNAEAAGHFDLQIAVRSFDAVLPRRPMTLTFVLDTSGSMDGEAIARERAAVKAIAKNLSAGDVVNIVTWSTTQNVVLDGHVAVGPNDPAVVGAANGLTADGGTDLEAGLAKGYQLATQHYGPSRLNRVVLVSDGGANVGVTSADLIAKHAKDNDQEGIYLVGIGTGPHENYWDGLMDTVTDEGRGAYVYLDSVAEADRVLGDRFDEVMEVAARAVQVELTLPWYFQMQAFHGEEFSENPEEVEPQHLAPSDAMVFHQVLAACDPSVVDPTDMISIAVDWTEPMTYAPQAITSTVTIEALLAGDKSFLHKGKAIVAYAKALSTAEPADLAAAHDAAELAGIVGDPELEEIASLLAAHPHFPSP